MATSHCSFSLGRVSAIAGNALTDLTRQKAFYFVLIFALILIGSSVFLAQFSFQQEFQILKDVSLGAMSIFSSLLAIVATARLIPQEIEDRTVYTILAKPVPRFEYLLGKLGGVLLLLALSLLIMAAMFFTLLYCREQAVMHETARQLVDSPPEQIDAAERTVTRVRAQPGSPRRHRDDLHQGLFTRSPDIVRFDIRDHEHFHDRGDGVCLPDRTSAADRSRGIGCRTIAPACSLAHF